MCSIELLDDENDEMDMRVTGWTMQQFIDELQMSNKVGTHFGSISYGIGLLFSTLTHCFDNVMFGVKLVFSQMATCEKNDRLSIIQTQLCEMTKSNVIFRNSDKRDVQVDCHIKNSHKLEGDKLFWGVMIKNKQNEMSYMEPKWNYQCHHCKSSPWFER